MGVKVTFMKQAEAKADADTVARSVLLVPKGAVRTDNNQSYAFVVSNGVVDRRAVKTGGVDGDRVEVLAGLASGERVIVSPGPTLMSGAIVVSK